MNGSMIPPPHHVVPFRAWSDPHFPGTMTDLLPFTIGPLLPVESHERGPR